jgi:hypothetical protein
VDQCLPSGGGCRHTTDDALCPARTQCDDKLDCIPRLLANSDTELYSVSLPSMQTELLANFDELLTDISWTDQGLFAVESGRLMRIDLTPRPTLSVALELRTTDRDFNALETAPGGALYAAGASGLFLLDPEAGTIEEVARLPAEYSSSGDLAALDGALYLTADAELGGASDWLLEWREGQEFSVLGRLPRADIWGLAALDHVLYGFTQRGEVLSIDPRSVTVQTLASGGPSFFGATGR